MRRYSQAAACSYSTSCRYTRKLLLAHIAHRAVTRKLLLVCIAHRAVTRKPAAAQLSLARLRAVALWIYAASSLREQAPESCRVLNPHGSMLFKIVQALVESRYAAGQGGPGTIRTPHGLYILGSGGAVIDVYIHMSDALRHTGIHHFDKILDHLIVIHIFLSLLQ